jgi:hypothetical protein
MVVFALGSDADSTKPPVFGGYGWEPAIAVTGGWRRKSMM